MSEIDKSILDANSGSVGKAFSGMSIPSLLHNASSRNPDDGAIGSKIDKLGGPFSSEGAVGKEFTEKGAVGGAAQDVAEQVQGDKPSLFDAKGAIGKQFTSKFRVPRSKDLH